MKTLRSIMAVAILAAGCAGHSGPQMKMVMNDHAVIGRYESEDDETYLCSVQDDFRVPKSGARVETWKAEAGEGVLYLRDFGTVPVYLNPDRKSRVVGHMEYSEGYVPEVYPCLGYSDGWFATEVDGQTGYVEQDPVVWDAINTF